MMVRREVRLSEVIIFGSSSGMSNSEVMMKKTSENGSELL